KQAQAFNVHGPTIVWLTLVFLLAVSQLALAVMNWLAGLLVRPRLLPRLDYESGIPEGARTVVVVPTLLSSTKEVERLIESVELHFLANRDPHVHFALLTDFCDAAAETMPGDAVVLQQVQRG